MPALTDLQRLRALIREHPLFRARDLAHRGISRKALERVVAEGDVTRVGRGLYRSTEADISEFQTIAEAAKRVPHGLVCLLSALRLHEMTTQAPFEIWMAISPDSRKPQVDYPPLRIVRFSGDALTSGRESREISGVTVHLTTPAKTVADCFKYRNKIGLDLALEALRDFIHERRGTLDELDAMARVCRVARPMRPYVEALV